MRKVSFFTSPKVMFLVPLLIFAVSGRAQSVPASATAAPSAQDSPPAQSASQLDNKNVDKRTLKLGGGDLLEIKVYGIPELTDDVRISARGDVSLPLVGSIHLEDLTSEQGERLIEKHLKEGGFVNDPHVSIFVKEYVTQGISVMGEVARPGIYPLLGTRRLFDALSFAGGTTQKAGRMVSITHRDTPDKPQMVALSNDLTKTDNVEILPGDTIVVSKAGIVYVVGQVVKPGGFVMENNESLTVLQALALAEGPGQSSSLDGAKIIRKTPEGLKDVRVPLKKMLEGKSADVAMQGDDILFVPASAGKNAARRTLEAVVQAATGMAVYRR